MPEARLFLTRKMRARAWIIKDGYSCYNAEFYSKGKNYGPKIIELMNGFIYKSFIQTAKEQYALHNAGCIELNQVFNSNSHYFDIITTNYDLIKGKNYGRYMSEVSDTEQTSTPQITRPTTGLANRIIIPNEKNVTIPAFD